MIGCSRVETPQGGAPGDLVELPIVFAIEGDAESKGVNDPDNIASVSEVIKNIWIIQFNGTSDDSKVLGEPCYIPDFSSFDGKVNLVVTDKPSTICFIANTFEPEGVFPVNQNISLGKLKSTRRIISSEVDPLGAEDDENFHPIFNGVTVLDKVENGLSISGILKRNVARLKIKVTNQAPQADAVSIKSLQICSVPSVSYYFTSHPSVVAPFPARADFTKINYEEIPWNAADGSMDIVAYVPVNLRGENTSVTNPSEKNKYAPDGSTYLLVSATYTDDGREYPITYTFFLGQNMLQDYNLYPNKSYNFDFVIKGKGNADEDYRITDWGYVDFTNEEMYELSNCYILNPIPGGSVMRSFRIPIKRALEFWGDGSTNNYENNELYSLRNNAEWRCFILASDFPIDDSKFRIIKGSGRSADDPYFEVEVAPGVEGNVIIGVGHTKDDQYTVSWSWHLWITEYDPYGVFELGAGVAGQYIYPVGNGSVHRYAGTFWNNNKSVYIMDRNLGSFSAEKYPDDNRGLLYYQYGRKDPFFQTSANYHIPLKDKKFSIVTYATANDEFNGVIYSVNNPMAFIKYKSSSDGCWTDGNKYNPSSHNANIIWNDPNTVSGGTRYGKKSLFDPCPPGFRMPNGTIWSDFSVHGTKKDGYAEKPTTNSYSSDYGDNEINAETPYIRGFKPYYVVKGLQYWPWDGNDIPAQVVFIPASGYLSQGGGTRSNYGNNTNNQEIWSFLWAESSNSINAGRGYTSQPNHLAPSNNTHKSRGLPVRCVSEKQ